ncbi:hypothetical protein [Leptothoe sp. PORK10 BA2]|uniref:hypothetical protein n=1 Tax=Leptothoe sp. PORK10 BA2 TaxID=3110254 RepID=UPI002B1EBEF2|nr:hypothetical protein [Leptothoe sp. PORK10 BA2]MEA5465223.1 hypothetical protein [Leptothoe sp. PORK10 BA2]
MVGLIIGGFLAVRAAKNVVDRIDNAIDSISSESSKWRETIDSLGKDLDKQLTKINQESRSWRQSVQEESKEWRDSLDSIVNKGIPRIISDTTFGIGIEFRCNIDFLLQRTQSELIELRNEIARAVNIAERANPFNIPVVCSTSPNSIDLRRIGSITETVNVAGYNFDKGSVMLKVKNFDSSIVDETDGVTVNNPYLLTIRIARAVDGADLAAAPSTVVLSNKTEQIFLELQNGEVLARIPISGQDVPGVVLDVAGRYISVGGDGGGGLTYDLKQQNTSIVLDEFDLQGKFISQGKGNITGRKIVLDYESFIDGETGEVTLNVQDNGDLFGEYIDNNGNRFKITLDKQ